MMYSFTGLLLLMRISKELTLREIPRFDLMQIKLHVALPETQHNNKTINKEQSNLAF